MPYHKRRAHQATDPSITKQSKAKQSKLLSGWSAEASFHLSWLKPLGRRPCRESSPPQSLQPSFDPTPVHGMWPHGTPVAEMTCGRVVVKKTVTAMACGRWLWSPWLLQGSYTRRLRRMLGKAYDAAEDRPCGAWILLTVFPPRLVGVIPIFCSLKLGVFAHDVEMPPVQHCCESLAHAQHVRVLALLCQISSTSSAAGPPARPLPLRPNHHLKSHPKSHPKTSRPKRSARHT